MSFWTSLTFARPTRPPRVTVADFVAFAARVASTGIIHPTNICRLQIKTGPSIDIDLKPITSLEEVAPQIYQPRTIAWDLALNDTQSFTAARPSLLGDNRTVYRAEAYFNFGCVDPLVREQLQTVRPDDDLFNLNFADLGVHVDVITTGGLTTERQRQVGWIGVSVGGPGYLFPWTPRQLIKRAATIPALQAVETVCRHTFPVSRAAGPPWTRLLRKIRHRAAKHSLGDFYPFDTGPLDWAWSINETG